MIPDRIANLSLPQRFTLVEAMQKRAAAAENEPREFVDCETDCPYCHSPETD